jgi:hypothetical protein
MRPFDYVQVGFVSLSVDDKLLGKWLSQNVHENVHNCGLGQFLRAVGKPCAYFNQQAFLAWLGC